MKGKSKKRVIAITIVGILLLVALVALSYAFWQRSFTQTTSNRDDFSCFNITYEDEGNISQLHGYPQTDEQGMENAPYQVKITNTCDILGKYNVILNKVQTENALDDSHLKVSVDGSTLLLSQAQETETQNIDGVTITESKIIGTGYVMPNSEKTVNVRTWMDIDTKANEGASKNFSYKIRIITESTKNTLAAKILSTNQIQSSEGINYSNGSPVCTKKDTDGVCTASETSEQGLFSALDDEGTSYYFRGAVKDNNVQFAQMNWKIVRINGDGSIRLFLNEDANLKSNFYNGNDRGGVAYTYNNDHDCTNQSPCISDYQENQFNKNYGENSTDSIVKGILEEWYKNNLAKYDSQIVLETFCNDTSIVDNDGSQISYASYFRTINDYKPILTCPNPTELNSLTTHNYGGVYKLKIGLLTADEMNMAGLSDSSNSQENYLYRKTSWWSLSPSYVQEDAFMAFILSANVAEWQGYIPGISNNGHTGFTYDVVPVINLTPDVKFTIEDPDSPVGTVDNPYIIE